MFHFLKLPKELIYNVKKVKLVKLLQTPERTQFKLMEVKKMKLQVYQEISLVL